MFQRINQISALQTTNKFTEKEGSEVKFKLHVAAFKKHEVTLPANNDINHLEEKEHLDSSFCEACSLVSITPKVFCCCLTGAVLNGICCLSDNSTCTD